MRTPLVRLDQIADVRLGRERSPKNHTGDQMRPYLRAANVGWSGLLLDDVKTMNFTDSEMAVYRLVPGDLLVGEASGSAKEVGKPAVWNAEIGDCAFQNTLLRVRPGGQAESRFLLHFFKHEAECGKFAARSRGVGISHLGREALAATVIPLPPVDEQRRIADILDRADALRAKRREALTLLDDLTQSIFIDMFGDTRSGRWARVPIESLIAETRLGLVRSSEEFGPALTTPYIRMNAITRDGELNIQGVQRTEVSAAEMAEYTLRSGDLLFNTRNSRDLVGKSALVREDLPAAVFNNNIMRIRFTDEVCPAFLARFLLSPHGIRELDRRKSGTTSVFAIYFKDLRSLPVPVPPIEMQREFSVIDAELNRRRRAARSQLPVLDALTDSLRVRAFAGEL